MRAVDGCGVAHPDGRERLICLTGCESKHRAGYAICRTKNEMID